MIDFSLSGSGEKKYKEVHFSTTNQDLYNLVLKQIKIIINSVCWQNRTEETKYIIVNDDSE